MKNFTGYKWWEQTNPAFRQVCFRKACKELIELNGKYEYLIKKNKP